MAELDCHLGSHIKDSGLVSISFWFVFLIFPTEARFFLEDIPFQDRLDLEFPLSGGPSAVFPLPNQVRLKRSAEKLLDDDLDDELQNKEKKTPRKFLGLRGKKAPSSFLGMRGRREDSTTYLSEGEFPYGDVYYEDLASSPLNDNELGQSLGALKRAPSAFLGMRGKKAPSAFLGMRGKKAPSAFLGMRGKKAPSSFLGMRGKKAPSSFLGMRGKKDYDYDDLDNVLQEYYEEKRAPRKFLGLRGKKFDDDLSISQDDDVISPDDVTDVVTNVKRVPSAFLGMRG